jgi:Cdc6-like AAA superfamily ATPase
MERPDMTLADEDWQILRAEIIAAFTPGQPINEADLFAGRALEIQRLQDTAVEVGKHALIYGDRGVGKTSIANIFHRALDTRFRKVYPIQINAARTDTFTTLWKKAFRRIKRTDDKGEWWAEDAHPGDISPDDVQIELGGFNPNEMPIVVIDEFDRVEDETAKVLMTDTIKAMSDYGVNCTVVLVGVGESVTDLIRGHESISRSLSQIQMPRMSDGEMRDIALTRLRRLSMAISDDALWRIAYHAAGLPFYVHSLAKHAALKAVSEKRRRIEERDVAAAFMECTRDVDYSIEASYVRATERIYRKPNIFPQVLAACALAERDSLGKFGAADVEAPLSAIMGSEYKTQSFAFHLNELCTEDRGNVLRKSGSRRTYRFQFKDAVMQPFVVMKSLTGEIITQDVLNRFALKRQKALSI